MSGSAASTVPCGVATSRICADQFCSTLIDFGFEISDRFWSATIESGGYPAINRGINASGSGTTIGVSTFRTIEELASDYFSRFMLIVY